MMPLFATKEPKHSAVFADGRTYKIVTSFETEISTLLPKNFDDLEPCEQERVLSEIKANHDVRIKGLTMKMED